MCPPPPRQYNRLELYAPPHDHPVVLISRSCFLLALLLCSVARPAEPTDWPQFLGPTRNGVYAGQDLAPAWPAGGPKILWDKKLGAGWSGPVVASGKLIIYH